ncbi:hypothetical protein ASE85_00060 [Sphingobium sp. Leaf26]|uniref:hypothetical protein n=1 Tax=Sphingobium sp. Leaf26 TaxID=1735693 RepID=UPI0006FFE826|nr:hypothetical protein [Sphingobium sp. Leaf26]KQN09418.1 hypothetical protein ASE85_00060 [Sphingobium sp. Leaf26]
MHMELTQGHNDLRVAMRDFAYIMQAANADDLPEVARRRIRFSQLFREHMGQEDAMVTALRRRSLTPQADSIVRDHGRAVVALFLRYSDHIKYWTPAQIGQDWPGYRDAVLVLQNALYDRMEWEEQHLHPLFTGPSLRAA